MNIIQQLSPEHAVGTVQMQYYSIPTKLFHNYKPNLGNPTTIYDRFPQDLLFRTSELKVRIGLVKAVNRIMES